VKREFRTRSPFCIWKIDRNKRRECYTKDNTRKIPTILSNLKSKSTLHILDYTMKFDLINVDLFSDLANPIYQTHYQRFKKNMKYSMQLGFVNCWSLTKRCSWRSGSHAAHNTYAPHNDLICLIFIINCVTIPRRKICLIPYSTKKKMKNHLIWSTWLKHEKKT